MYYIQGGLVIKTPIGKSEHIQLVFSSVSRIYLFLILCVMTTADSLILVRRKRREGHCLVEGWEKDFILEGAGWITNWVERGVYQ